VENAGVPDDESRVVSQLDVIAVYEVGVFDDQFVVAGEDDGLRVVDAACVNMVPGLGDAGC
jgi:hypothetical protein